MSKCGFYYKGNWYDTTQALVKDVTVDARTILTSTGNFKRGFNADSILNTVKNSTVDNVANDIKITQTKIDETIDSIADPSKSNMEVAFLNATLKSLFKELKTLQDSVPTIEKKGPKIIQKFERPKPTKAVENRPTSPDYRVAKEAVKQYRLKSSRKTKDGKTSKVEFNLTEELKLVESFRNNYIRGFVDSLAEQAGDAVINTEVNNGFYRNIARKNTINDLNALRKELKFLVKEVKDTKGDDSTEYLKITQYAFLLNEFLTKDPNKITKLLYEAEEMALEQLGYTVTINDTDYNTESSEKGVQQDAFQNKSFSIMKKATDGMTARLRAKLSVLEKYTVVEGKVVPATNLFGSSIFDDRAYVKLMSLLSKGVDYSWKEKEDTIIERVNEVSANPELNLESMYLISLLDDMNAPVIMGGWDYSEKQQFSGVMDKDILNMRGLTVATESESNSNASNRLIETNYTFVSLFRKAIVDVKNSMTTLKSTNSAYILDDIIAGNKIIKGTDVTTTSVLELRRNLRNINKLDTTTEEYLNSLSLKSLSTLLKGYTESVESLQSNPMKGSIDYKKSHGVLLHKEINVEGETVITHSSEGKQLLSDGYSIRKLASNVLANKVTVLLSVAEVPIGPDTESVLANALFKGINIPIVSFSNTELTTTVPLIEEIPKFIKDLHGLTKDQAKQPSQSIKNILNWTIRNTQNDITGTVIQIGSKKLSAFNDPISLHQELKRLHSPKYREKYKEDFFANKSRLFNLQGKVDLPWFDNVFKNPSRAGLLATWLSDADKTDTAENHTLFRLSSYLQRVSYGYKSKRLSYPGEMYSTIRDTIGEDILNNPVSYTLQVREGVAQLATTSDKGHIFNITTPDFKAVTNVENGVITFDDDVVNYFIDSVITPELNRIIQTRGRDVQNVSYNGDFVYQIKALNKGRKIQKLLKNLDLGGKELHSLFSKDLDILNRKGTDKTINKEANLAEIRRFVIEVTKEHLNKAVNNQINKATELKLFVKEGNEYFLGEEVKEVEDFKRLSIKTSDQELELVDTNTQVQIGEIFTSFASKILNNGGGWISALRIVEVLSPDLQGDKLDIIARTARKLDKSDPENAPVLILKKLGFNFTLEQIQKLASVSESTKEKEYNKENPTVDTDDFFGGPDFSLTQEEALANYDLTKYAYTGSELYLKSYLPTALGKTQEIEGKVKINLDTLLEVLGNKVVGDGFSMANMFQTIYGDIANFYVQHPDNGGIREDSPKYNINKDIDATMTNTGKRLASFVSPVITGEGSNTVHVIVTTEPTIASKHYDGKKVKLNANSIDLADGASLMLIDDMIAFKVQEGSLKPKFIKDTKLFLTGKITGVEFEKRTKLKISDVNDLTMKPRGAGFETRDVLDQKGKPVGIKTRHMVYLKSGDSALSEHFTGTDQNNPLVKRRLAMEQLSEELNKGKTIENDYATWTSVRIVPKSVIKNGHPAEFFDIDNAERIDGKFDFSKSIVSISMGETGRQQRTDTKDDKQVYDSGQMEDSVLNVIDDKFEAKVRGEGTKKKKILELWEKALQEEYLESTARLSNLLNNETLEETLALLESGDLRTLRKTIKGLRVSGEDLGTSDKSIANIIIASLRRQDKDILVTNPQIMRWLELNNRGEFKNDITLAPDFITYSDRVRKEMEGQTVKRKKPGSQLALHTDLGINLADETQGYTLLPNIDLDTPDENGVIRLRPPMPGIDGKLSKPGQILVPFSVYAYNLSGERIKLKMSDLFIEGTNKLDPKKITPSIMSQIGFRTPTQGISMVSSLEIVGFLPESMGNVVIMPAEFVELMGHDFDIDKLFAYKYELIMENLKSGGWKLAPIAPKHTKFNSLLKFAEINNRKMNILLAVLDDDTVIRDHIIQSLDSEKRFVEVAERLKKIKNEDNDYTKASVLDSTYQETKAVQADSAATAVAVFAKLLRVYSKVKIANLETFAQKKIEDIIKLVAVEIKAGDKVISHFAAEGDNMFKRNKDLTFEERTMNAISVLISLAVDNEKLQILADLGIGGHSYSKLQALVVSGFSAESAISMINLPVFKEGLTNEDTNIIISKLISRHNTLSPTTILTLTGKNKPDSANISFLKGDKDYEDVFIRNINDLDRAMRNIDSMNEQQVIDVLGVISLVNTIDLSYQKTVKPVGNMFNIDSKGFPRETTVLDKLLSHTTSEYFEDVWKDLKKVPSIQIPVQHMKAYQSVSNNLYGDKESIRDVARILSESNIKITGFSDIALAVKSIKFKSRKPDINHLIQRLSLIRTSSDKEVKTLVASNPFLRSLDIKNDEIVFSRDANITMRDVINGLESLPFEQDVLGIDMRLFYDDIINHGLTNKAVSYGNEYNRYIYPEHYTSAVMTTDKMPAMQLALFVAFKNISKVPKKGKFIKKYVTKSKEQMLLYLEGDEWKPYTILDFYKNNGDPRTPLKKSVVYVSSPDGTIPDPDAIDLDATMERVFASRSAASIKVFLKTVFKDKPFKTVRSEIKNSWSRRHERMSLKFDEDVDSITTLRGNIVHESMHAALDSLAESYLKGTLMADYPGLNVESLEIAQEMARVFTSLETERIKMVDATSDAIIQSMDEEFKTVPVENEINESIPHQAALAGMMTSHILSSFNNGTEFLSLLSEEDIRTFLKGSNETRLDTIVQNLDSLGDENSILTKAESKALIMGAATLAMEQGLLTVVAKDRVLRAEEAANPTNVKTKDTILLFSRPGKKVSEGYNMSAEAFRGMQYTFIVAKEKFEEQNRPLFRELSSYMEDDVYKEERIWYQKFVYGLTDLHEFMSESYSKGAYSTDFISYSRLSQYTGAFRSMPIKILEMFNKAMKLIKDLISKLGGKKFSNELFKDVAYLATLSNKANFVKQGVKQEWSYTDLAQDIIKIC